MKKFCRKGHLKRSGKRWLALLMSVCLIGTMIPVTARAENGSTETGLCEHHTEHTPECGYVAPAWGHECEHVHDESCGYQEASECNHVHTEECGENGENCTHVHTSECGYAEGHACEHVHDEECGYAEASEGSPCTFVCDICGKEAEPEQTEGKLITTWQWIDEEEYLDEETGNLALPGASEQTPAYFDDVTAFLPTQILATVEEAEETITLGDWSCDNFPEEGAYSGSYTFTATLPEGYALSEEAEALEVLVELGGAQNYEATAEGYDENGFCTSYELTDGTWALKDSATACATHGDACKGYQPAVEEQLDYDINGDKEIDANDKAYKITNAGQLYWFAGLVNGTLAGVTQNKYANAVLTANITVNENVLKDGVLNSEPENLRAWTPIGPNINNSYYGSFDGQGYTVSGLYFNDTSVSFVGLFGWSMGTIKNVGVVASYLKGKDYVGGVCGESYNGKCLIMNCYNTSTVCGTYEYVGGVCGSNYGSVTNCYNTGEVTATHYKAGVGGVCGYESGTTTNCYNTGGVTATGGNSFAGGVCGYLSAGTITNCYNTGTVSGSNQVGGVCGKPTDSGTIKNCYYLDTITNDSNATAKTTAQFASGEVTYLLNECKSGADVVWRQTLTETAKDAIPVLDISHSIVYVSQPCEIAFANEVVEKKHNAVTMSGDGTSHTCSVCNKTEQHADVATFTVDETEHSITATCPSGCELGTITLSASDATYDGTEKAASISDEIKGFTTPDIVYEKQAEDGSYETIDSTPKDAGTYKASITYNVNEEENKVYSVNVEYTISPATPTITWGSDTKTVGYTGNAITKDAIGAPTVTLVNGEKFNGTIQYSYRAKDSSDEFTSGLPTERGTYEVKASVAADGNYTAAESTMILTIDWLSEVSDATLKDQDGKELTGNTWWAQSVTFTPPEGFTISNSLTDSFGTSFVYNEQTGADGTEVTYYLKDTTSGEIAQKTATVHIDKTAPDWNGENDGISIKTNKWKSLLSTISFGLFYKEAVDVEVRANDSLSGVAAYYYYVDSAGGTVKTAEQLDEISFTKYTDGVSGENPSVTVTSLAPDENYIVYAYAVDKAGNRSAYVCSEGIVVDSIAPAISNIVAPDEEASTLTDTTAQISFTGSEAGTYFYMVKESSETAPTTITDFATSDADSKGMTTWTAKPNVSSASMKADADNKITLSNLNANTEYILYLAAVDLAGNSSTVYSQNFTTCRTIPTVADADMPKISGIYGQTVADMTLTPGIAKVGNDTITGTWAVNDSSKTDVPAVGTTNTYQVTFTPDASYNDMYDTVNVQVTPTVAQKVVTVTAENKTKTYGQENPAFTFTVPEGALVGTDTNEALAVELSCEAKVNSPVTTEGYAITGTSSSANYEVTVIPGTLTIEKADATITVETGKDSYSKTFGDADFTLSGISDTNTEANVQYEVTTGTGVITVSNGTVTILKAGNATITVSLPASTNYKAAEDKTITVTVAKNSDYTVADINKSYLYSRNNADTIDLSGYLPANCGTVTYGIPQPSGTVEYTVSPAVADGKLSYTVKKAETYGAAGTIKVTVTTENYADFIITVNVKLTDKTTVTLSGVTCDDRVYNGTAYVYTGTPVWKTAEGGTTAGKTTVTYYKVDNTPLESAPTNAGRYRAEFTIESDAYEGTESYSFEITKAEITVAAKDRNIYTGDTVPDLTNPTAGTDYTVTGLYGTDAVSGTAIMSYGQTPDNTKAGTYEILISGLTVPGGDNYTITFKNGTLTITTKPSGGGGSSSGGSSGGSTGGGSSSGGESSSGDSSGGSGNTGGSEVTTGKDSESNAATTTSPTEVKVENGSASATVKAENVTEAIKQAADNQSAEIVFTVSEKDTGNADNIQLTMTTSDVKQILDKTDADLVVATTAGDVILPQEALKEAVSAAGGNTITIGIDKVTTPTAAQKEAAGENSYIVEVTISSQNEAITTFGGNTLKIRLEIPAALAGKDVAVIHIAADGKTEKMPGKMIQEGTKQYYEFTTTHLSTFALVDSSIIEEETPAVTAPKKGTLLTDSKTKMVYKVTKSGTTGGTVQFVKTKNTKAKTVAIPDKVTIDGITYKVTSIAANALKNNKTVTTVTIGKYVTSIGSNAFYGCSKLKKVTIGKGVTSIGSKAFYKCTSLTGITIPSKVTKIGDYVFKGCTKLKTINLNTMLLTTKTVSGKAFSGVSTSAVVRVPKSKLESYKKLFVKKGLSKKVKIKKK